MSDFRIEAEFKEFEPRLKYGWFNLNCIKSFKTALNLNHVLADLSRGSNSLISGSGILNSGKNIFPSNKSRNKKNLLYLNLT